MAKTRAQLNRAVRQEALREQLAAQGHVQHVIDNLEEMQKLDGKQETDKFNIDKLKIINEQKMKLISKYLPDLKAVELTGEAGGPVSIEEWMDQLD